VLALPLPNQSTLVWQHVARLVLEAAESGDTEALCDWLERALRMDGRLRKDLQSSAPRSRRPATPRVIATRHPSCLVHQLCGILAVPASAGTHWSNSAPPTNPAGPPSIHPLATKSIHRIRGAYVGVPFLVRTKRSGRDLPIPPDLFDSLYRRSRRARRLPADGEVTCPLASRTAFENWF
jgi:hypothetical protein